jgi:hypothetical protein
VNLIFSLLAFFYGGYMDGLPFFIFFTFTIITFFGISITAVTIWVKSTKATKSILKDPNTHWSLKGLIYYGIFFSIFIGAAVFISLIIGLAIFLWSINV